jgi:RNA polymerase sigma factor (TIGR02999 family)
MEPLDVGKSGEVADLFAEAYAELSRIAHAQRRRWSGEQTLSTTVLVHEAFLKLSRSATRSWPDRSHFLRVASRAMRQLLVNYALHRRAGKRGGGRRPVPQDAVALVDDARIDELLALDRALDRLAQQNPRWARVVECRAFAGLEVDETAEALSLSPTTVKRDWRRAQAWLYAECAAIRGDE